MTASPLTTEEIFDADESAIEPILTLHSLLAPQPEDRSMQRFAGAVGRIRHFAGIFRAESDAAMRQRAQALGIETRGGSTRPDLHPEALALVSESVRRTRGLSAYDCQLAAGLALVEGRLVEMATGEGKTLVALLPAFCFALHGLGVHVATVNPYLAERDFEFARRVFQRLGLSIGLLPAHCDRAQRHAAYACDVTYGVGTEFGFDFLRDRVAERTAAASGAPAPALLQRGHAFAVIDDADSVLIDEAGSPLCVAAGERAPNRAPERYRLADRIAAQLGAGDHFFRDPYTQRLTLNAPGKKRAIDLLPDPVLERLDRDWTHYVECALHARLRLRRNAHYVVEQGKVIVIDESTGRRCPDRTWRDGLHQAVEAHAGVEISDENFTEATITRPAYFRLYRRICGITGTAFEAAAELRANYALAIEVIPQNRPAQRADLPDRVFSSRNSRLAALAREVAMRHARGQPVLVGTRTVESSEAAAVALAPLGIAIRMLHATQDSEEASIIAQAGEPGAVTIATHMAGRGAHIPVHERALAADGLHVIGIERYESARIDRQLIGRTARHGQPGSAQFFLSLEDELLARHAPDAAARLAQLRSEREGEVPGSAATHFQRAQRRAELIDRDRRRALARFDGWLNDPRHSLCPPCMSGGTIGSSGKMELNGGSASPVPP